MEPCFLPFDISDWQSVEVIEGRVATQDDVNSCSSVFAAGQGQSELVVTPGLPALALLKNADGSETKIVIVQIEKQIGGELTVVGYVLPAGGNGMGTIEDVQVIEYSK
jgi:hypothetical protein